MASYNTTYTNRKSTQVNGAIKSNNVTVAAMYSEDVSIKDIDTTLPLENDNTFKGLFTYLEKLESRVHDLENQGGTTPVEPDPVKVTGISVSPTTLNLTEAGATGRLTVTITPDNATNKNVTWSTNNDAVATVSNDGTVTTVGNGNAIITVKSVDGDYTATCTVTVNVQEEEYYWFAAQTNPTLPEVDPESFEVDKVVDGKKYGGWFTFTEEQLSAGQFSALVYEETAGTWYIALPVEGNWKITASDYHTISSGTINRGTITYKTKLYNVWEIEGTSKRMTVLAAKIN